MIREAIRITSTAFDFGLTNNQFAVESRPGIFDGDLARHKIMSHGRSILATSEYLLNPDDTILLRLRCVRKNLPALAELVAKDHPETAMKLMAFAAHLEEGNAD